MHNHKKSPKTEDPKKKKLLSRRNLILSTIGAGVSTTIYGCGIEPRWLVTSRQTLSLSKVKPDTEIRILHLADFHYSKFVSLSFIHSAIKRGLDEKPDIAFITGDFVTHRPKIDEQYSQILKSLSDKIPAYACLGNHDGGIWSQGRDGLKTSTPIKTLLKNGGIHLLYNESAKVKLNNQVIQVLGLGDYWTKELNAEKAFQNHELNPETPTIVLSHNPDSKIELEEYPWDLMLCGHTHGGQIRIPFVGSPFAPIKDKRYVSGLNPWKDRFIHTTCGVGNLYGTRFNSPPEISIITLNPIL